MEIDYNDEIKALDSHDRLEPATSHSGSTVVDKAGLSQALAEREEAMNTAKNRIAKPEHMC